SLTLYDRLLQGFAGQVGPTHLGDRHLAPGGGAFVAVLGHRDLGWPGFMDVSDKPSGVVAFRQIGGGDVTPPRLEILDEDRAAEEARLSRR
ncbi:MAG: hypothetical protein JRI25_24890, partial [Deltaproteobacteria bacterium]|nr:hypothetical protein [Deltaproteobacteria bacterium]